MEGERFDAVAKRLSAGGTRRWALGVLLSSTLLGLVHDAGEAKKRHPHARGGKHKHQRGKRKHQRHAEPDDVKARATKHRKCGGDCSPYYGVNCPDGCVCSGALEGTCITAPAPGTCGGGCGPACGVH